MSVCDDCGYLAGIHSRWCASRIRPTPSAHELPKLLTARRKAQRVLADAEYTLDEARKAYEAAQDWHTRAQHQAEYASNAYDEARAEVNDLASSGS